MTQVERLDSHDLGRPITENPVRASVRFPIRIALTVQTDTGSFPAFTENVSANGVLFTCESLPKINSQIEFTMLMPAAIMGADKDVSIHCIGRIVRHDSSGVGPKAAAVIDEYFLKA